MHSIQGSLCGFERRPFTTSSGHSPHPEADPPLIHVATGKHTNKIKSKLKMRWWGGLSQQAREEVNWALRYGSILTLCINL